MMWTITTKTQIIDPVLERSWRKWIKESRKPRGGQPPKSTGRQRVLKKVKMTLKHIRCEPLHIRLGDFD
jgi:hypothetical protein